MAFDYRAARDWVFGIKRASDSDKIKEIVDTRTTIAERTLLLALIEFAPNIEPSAATLAKMLGSNARSVRRLVRSCEAKMLLTVAVRPIAPNRFDTNRYTLRWTSSSEDPTDSGPVVTLGPNPPDGEPKGVLSLGPPKQTNKADKKADRKKIRSCPVNPPSTVAPEPDDAGQHSELTKLYFDLYAEARGVKPPFDSRDGKAVRDLLAACGAAMAADAIRGAFADNWWRCKATIRDVALQPARFLGLKSRGSLAPPLQHRQPDSGYSPSDQAREIK